MKKHQALRVDAIIKQALEASGTTRTFNQQQACFIWPEIVGPAINRCTLRRWVDGDVMHVTLTSASLKQELAFVAESLVQRINDAVGSRIINKIVFH